MKVFHSTSMWDTFSILLLTIDDLPCPSFGFSNLSTRVDCYTIDSDGLITIRFHRKGVFVLHFRKKGLLFYDCNARLYSEEWKIFFHTKNQCHPEQGDNQAYNSIHHSWYIAFNRPDVSSFGYISLVDHLQRKRMFWSLDQSDNALHLSIVQCRPFFKMQQKISVVLKFYGFSSRLSSFMFFPYRYVWGFFNSHYPIQQCVVVYWTRNNIWSFQSVSIAMYTVKKRVVYETPKVLEVNIIPSERLSEREKLFFRSFQKSFRITQVLDDNIGFRRQILGFDGNIHAHEEYRDIDTRRSLSARHTVSAFLWSHTVTFRNGYLFSAIRVFFSTSQSFDDRRLILLFHPTSSKARKEQYLSYFVAKQLQIESAPHWQISYCHEA